MSVSISGAGSISGLDQGFNVTTGSVGVGTDNPTVKLDIVDSGSPNIALRGSSYPSIRYSALDGTTDAEIYYGISGNDLVFNNVNAGPIALKTSNAERLSITSAGNVGINDTAPSEKLNVGGNIMLEGSDQYLYLTNVGTGNAGMYIRGRDATSELRSHSTGMFTWEVTGSEKMRITSDGKVGINDTSPASLFTVNNGTTDSQCVNIKNDNVGLLIGTYGTGHGSYPREVTINGTRTDSGSSPFLRIGGQGGIKFCVDLNTERMRINSAGKLTVTPADTTSSYATTDGGIDIAQTISSTGTSASQSIGIQFSLTKSGQTGAIAEIGAIREGSGLSGLVFRTRDNSTGRNERVRITSGGKLCVNTTLSNYGVVQIRDASGDSTTSAIQVENASSGSNTTNVISRSVSLNSGAWANAEYRAKSHIFSYQTTPVATIQQHGLTIASQPCFWATSNTGGAHTNNGATGIISNQLEAAYVNVGNHFNTSTGVFTCPVAGTYEFHGQGLVRYQAGVGRAELSFYKNGSNTITRAYGYTYITGVSDHDNLHVMGYITCAANDQIDLRVSAMDSGVDCYFAQGLGYFAGRLVQ